VQALDNMSKTWRKSYSKAFFDSIERRGTRKETQRAGGGAPARVAGAGCSGGGARASAPSGGPGASGDSGAKTGRARPPAAPEGSVVAAAAGRGQEVGADAADHVDSFAVEQSCMRLRRRPDMQDTPTAPAAPAVKVEECDTGGEQAVRAWNVKDVARLFGICGFPTEGVIEGTPRCLKSTLCSAIMCEMDSDTDFVRVCARKGRWRDTGGLVSRRRCAGHLYSRLSNWHWAHAVAVQGQVYQRNEEAQRRAVMLSRTRLLG